ncbi:hypothetical protein DXG01_005450 [Tephrocybe rancida]|nr:hypothetical protein DXG01_005450 [Tephrocybe rancida]
MATYLPMVQQFFTSATGSNLSATPPPTTNATTFPGRPATFPNEVSSIFAFILSYSALRDWLKLIVIGGIFESFRRLIMTCYYKFIDSFFIRASFDNNDPSYEWILVWLSKQPSWSKTRDMQITTRVSGGNSPAVVLEGEEDNVAGFFKSSRKIAYLPSASLVYSLWFKRRWMTITRVQQATGNQWNHVACRAKRSLNSIVLDPGVKDVLLEDARDFLQSKSWYAERGIPFRRGYLLYGAPGSGKTSMIHCMAGELKLDVYIISLSRAGLDDASLSELVNALPERCLALMEDIDAAFTHGVSRGGMTERDDDENAKKTNTPGGQPPPGTPPPPTSSRLSLSGLLNALDGVGAQEGRILFATTNRYSALDQALCRPGRMDLHIEFKNASKYQARELFSRFYLPTPQDEGKDAIVTKADTVKTRDGDSSPNEKALVSSEPGGDRTTPSVDLSLITGQTHTGRAPTLSQVRVAELAERFADAIPDRECSMASLQGYLMTYKTRPMEAADGVAAWVEKERQGKQEREAKEKSEKEKQEEAAKKESEKKKASDPVSAAPAATPVLKPCSCHKVPTCPTCGGVKVEEVVVALPTPVSKPASPVEESAPQLLAPEDAVSTSPP